MTFGERLKFFRENKQLTQEQLAEMIGVAKSTITGYEKNNREPDVLKIKKLAYALDITGDDLLGIEPQKSTDFSREDLEVLSNYCALDIYGQKTVRYVIESEQYRMKEQKKNMLVREQPLPHSHET